MRTHNPALISQSNRVLQEDPHAIIDLWYAEFQELPSNYNFGSLLQSGGFNYSQRVSACGSIPFTVVPSESQPLQLFSFNATKPFDASGNNFMILGDTIVVVELLLKPLGDARFGLTPTSSLKSLIPLGLDPSPQRGFEQIRFDADVAPSEFPKLTIDIPADATHVERAVYQHYIEALSQTAVHDGQQSWTIADFALAIGEDGHLKPIPCSK